MHEGWLNQIKSCVWHNLLKADFAPHTITVVLWDSRTSTSQDKMIYNMKMKHTKSCSMNYSMSLSLSLTQNECTNLTQNECTKIFSPGSFFFFWKVIFINENYEYLYVTETEALCFSDNCCAHRLTDSTIKIIKYYYLDK